VPKDEVTVGIRMSKRGIPRVISLIFKEVSRMYRKQSEAGFTLIELVIVIVILGILAAVAIPKYEDMREQARVATVRGQLGSIRSAIAIQYARNAINGSAHFPPLDGTIFAEGRVPVDPVMNSSAVKTTYGITNTGGWVYQQTTGIVKVNLNAYSSY
jgi:prepilin-type N-terminal cleavage/methylation domain-containing protein